MRHDVFVQIFCRKICCVMTFRIVEMDRTSLIVISVHQVNTDVFYPKRSIHKSKTQLSNVKNHLPPFTKHLFSHMPFDSLPYIPPSTRIHVVEDPSPHGLEADLQQQFSICSSLSSSLS